MDQIWAEERDQSDLVIKYLCGRRLFSGKSPYQKVEVYESKRWGRILFNDHAVMITERDEFVYHEMIAHTPLFVHPNPKKVLIIGGGDGGTAREVLKHSSVELCRMVEIDEMVVSACREYIPQTSLVFSNPKLDLIIGDGVKFVKETKEKFDVVIVDSTDPVGPAVPLFGKEFYADVHKALSEDGIVTAQGESAFYNLPAQKRLALAAKDLFEIVNFYHYSNMTYPGGLWSFLWASKKYDPIKDFDPKKPVQSKIDFKYYNQKIHCSSFTHPAFVKKELNL